MRGEQFVRFVEHLAAATSDVLPLEGCGVGLILFKHHHDGAKCAEKVIEKHALFNLFNSLEKLTVFHQVIIIVLRTPFEKEKVMLGQFLDFRQSRPIFDVVCDAAVLVGVCVVAAPFIKIVCQVVVLWVPHSELIVNQHDLSVISQVYQDIALHEIVMRETDLLSGNHCL